MVLEPKITKDGNWGYKMIKYRCNLCGEESVIIEHYTYYCSQCYYKRYIRNIHEHK